MQLWREIRALGYAHSARSGPSISMATSIRKTVVDRSMSRTVGEA
jgi:hypothetical protein